MLPFSPPTKKPIVIIIITITTRKALSGLEICTTKPALQHQIDNQGPFQAHHHTVQPEGLHAQDEDFVAWHLDPTMALLPRLTTHGTASSGIERGESRVIGGGGK